MLLKTSIILRVSLFLWPYLALPIARVAMEGSSWGEFSEFMANHIFRYVYRDELFAIVHRERKSNGLGDDGGSP